MTRTPPRQRPSGETPKAARPVPPVKPGHSHRLAEGTT
jgi:hypothetical protein